MHARVRPRGKGGRDSWQLVRVGGDDEDLNSLLGDGTMNAATNDDDIGGSSADVDLAILHVEHRPLLLNRVLLRQKTHNVGEWIKRSTLYLDLDEVDLAASALDLYWLESRVISYYGRQQ